MRGSTPSQQNWRLHGVRHLMIEDRGLGSVFVSGGLGDP
jgi:hypothetical protein